MHETTIIYDRTIIRKAVRFFWLRYTRGGMGALVIALLSLTILLVSGDRSWVAGMIGTVCLMGAITSVSLYFAVLSRSIQKLERMSAKEVRMTFTDERFSIKSSNSDASMSWNAIKQIWKSSDFWLIFVGGGAAYFTLPLKSVDSSAQAFILQKVREHGGRIK